jgi:hypothetical protein
MYAYLVCRTEELTSPFSRIQRAEELTCLISRMERQCLFRPVINIHAFAILTRSGGVWLRSSSETFWVEWIAPLSFSVVLESWSSYSIDSCEGPMYVAAAFHQRNVSSICSSETEVSVKCPRYQECTSAELSCKPSSIIQSYDYL